MRRMKDLCCMCGYELDGYGNNPEPLALQDNERCCDVCNGKYVLPARMYQLNHGRLTDRDVETIRLNILYEAFEEKRRYL